MRNIEISIAVIGVVLLSIGILGYKQADLQVWEVLCTDKTVVYVSANRWPLEREIELCE